MSTVTLRSLSPQLATKLSQLEVAAALLDRDARTCRAALSELGLAAPRATYPWLSWTGIGIGSKRMASRAARATLKLVDEAKRGLQSPRLARVLRLTVEFTAQCTLCVVIASAILMSFACAIVVLAPPL